MSVGVEGKELNACDGARTVARCPLTLCLRVSWFTTVMSITETPRPCPSWRTCWCWPCRTPGNTEWRWTWAETPRWWEQRRLTFEWFYWWFPCLTDSLFYNVHLLVYALKSTNFTYFVQISFSDWFIGFIVCGNLLVNVIKTSDQLDFSPVWIAFSAKQLQWFYRSFSF